MLGDQIVAFYLLALIYNFTMFRQVSLCVALTVALHNTGADQAAAISHAHDMLKVNALCVL